MRVAWNVCFHINVIHTFRLKSRDIIHIFKCFVLNMFVYFRQIGGSFKPTDTCFHFPIACSEVVYNRNTCKCSGVV